MVSLKYAKMVNAADFEPNTSDLETNSHKQPKHKSGRMTAEYMFKSTKKLTRQYPKPYRPKTLDPITPKTLHPI